MIKTYLILMMLLTIGFCGVHLVLVAGIKKYFGIRTYFSLAVILASGFIFHNAVIFMCIASVVMLATVQDRMDILCRLVILVALIPNVDQYITVGGLNLLFISTPVVMSLFALIACSFLRRPGWSPKLTAEDALVLLLILCFGVGAARASSFTGMQRSVVSALLGIGLSYFVFRRFVRSQSEHGHIIAVLAGCALILAFFAVSQARLHWSLYETIYNNQATVVGMSRNTKMRAGFLRAPASFSDSTAFAVFQIVGIFAVICSRRFFRGKFLWTGSIILAVIGLLAAQSRGADLGLLLGLFLMMAVRRRYALAAAMGGGGVLLVALLIVVAQSSPKVAAFIAADNHSGEDQDYRQTLLRRGLQVGMEHPLLGDDMTRVIDKMSDIRQGEGLVDLVNSYLNIFLNSGLVGLGVFTILLVVIFIKLFRAGRSNSDNAFISLQMFEASALGGVLFALAFTSFMNERNPYWFMILLAGCGSLSSKRPASSAKAAQQPEQIGEFNSVVVHRWQTDS